MTADPDSRGSGSPSVKKWSRPTAFLVLGAIVAVIIGIPIAGWQLIYSSSHRSWVRCTVVSAEGGHVSARVASGPAVFVKTTDCGLLAYRWKVTDQNRDEFAGRFRPGAAYDFLMAPADRWVAAHPNPVIDTASFWDYRRSSR